SKVKWTIEGEGEFVVVPPADGIVATGSDGISSVRVKLKSTAYATGDTNAPDKLAITSRITAVLLDEHEAVVDVPVHFNLHNSIARNVEYVPGSCPNLVGRTTGQTAIERL